MLPRRKLITAAGATALTTPAFAHATTPIASASSARIGDVAQAFDAEFGPGQLEGDFAVYGDLSDNLTDYWVHFNPDGLAESVESDFTVLEGGFAACGWIRLGNEPFSPQ